MLLGAYIVAGSITLITVIVTCLLCRGKSRKTKFINWGIPTSIIFAPAVSWMLGIAYAGHEGDGFAGIAVIILLFPTLVVTGIILIIVGVVSKKKPAEPIEE